MLPLKLRPCEFAYIPSFDGEPASALTLVNHHILNFLDKTSGVVGLRVLAADLSKAFDRSTLASIVSVLVNFTLPLQVVLANFLSGRLQRVQFDGKFSKWYTIVVSPKVVYLDPSF